MTPLRNPVDAVGQRDLVWSCFCGVSREPATHAGRLHFHPCLLTSAPLTTASTAGELSPTTSRVEHLGTGARRGLSQPGRTNTAAHGSVGAGTYFNVFNLLSFWPRIGLSISRSLRLDRQSTISITYRKAMALPVSPGHGIQSMTVG